VVTLTNALALVTAEQLAALSPKDPVRAMFTLTLLVGAIMAGLGALKLGSVIRFVSKEVMSGFVFATALLIVLGQYKDLVGYASTLEANKLVKAIDITLHAGSWSISAALVGFASIILLFVLKASPFKKWADILIIIISTLFVALVPWKGIELVGDVATVPSGLAALPAPMLPDFSMIPRLLGAALAATVIGLAESSGVGAAYPNPDGSRSDMSRDFLGQGLGNVAGSFLQAMPAGGSLSRTGVNASGGAQSRWAGVYSGLLLAFVLVLFGGAAEFIPMTGLAALLIVIGIEVMIKEGRELVKAWKISQLNTAVAVVTVLVGVLDDLTAAIFVGVVLSLILYAATSATHLRTVELAKNAGRWVEQEAPQQLDSNRAYVIEIQGNLNFASVYSFDELLPDVGEASNAVVVLHARYREIHSLTGLDWLEKYAADLEASGNRLMLAGVEKEVMDLLQDTEISPENVFPAEAALYSATEAALEKAESWIRRGRDE
jgi:SulP family sulfate permease